MKRFVGMAFLLSAMFLYSFVSAQSIDDVISAIRTSNASKLSEFFDSRVDISLPGRSDNYSKSQAELIIKDFFSSNKVKSFDIKHKGENTDGSYFCVGTLLTSSGTYRTKIFLKNKGGEQVLQEFGVELVH